MGHQFTFYITPKDTFNIENLLQQRGALILHSRSATANPRVLDSLNVEENGQPWLFLFLVRPDDLCRVVTKYIPVQNYWAVDVLKSPAIEFTRSFFDGKILRQGRAYYKDGFYGSDEAWVEKDSAFTKWAKSVFSTIKKTLRRQGTDYIGEDALAWLKSSGGKLVL